MLKTPESTPNRLEYFFYFVCFSFSALPGSVLIGCNAQGKMFQRVPSIFNWLKIFLKCNINGFARLNPEQNIIRKEKK